MTVATFIEPVLETPTYYTCPVLKWQNFWTVNLHLTDTEDDQKLFVMKLLALYFDLSTIIR